MRIEVICIIVNGGRAPSGYPSGRNLIGIGF